MLQPRMSSLILLLLLVLCVVPAGAQPAIYCKGERCPTLYMIEGFEVWMSPSLPDNPAYSHEYLERYLDTVQAQLLFMDSPGVIPPEAMNALRDSGMSIYIDDPDNKQKWWPCGEGIGCYNGALNQIGGSFFGHNTANVLAYWHEFSFILHEAAHAYHFQVVTGGSGNPCVIEVYERNKHRYERVEKSFRPPEHGIEIGHHYAYTNYAEYFACLTETYFLRNGAYPWNDIELFKHDPEGYYLIKEAWNDPDFCESGFRNSYRNWVTHKQQEKAKREAEERVAIAWAESEREAAAMGSCTISRASFGGHDGTPFLPAKPLQLSIRTGAWVDAIILNGHQHGGNGGWNVQALDLLPGEYINRAVIGAGAYVDRLEFYTNFGRSISGGTGNQGGIPVSLDNIRVLRIGGSSNVYLDRIEVMYCADYEDRTGGLSAADQARCDQEEAAGLPPSARCQGS